jgi:hypothetical protein
MLTTVSAVNALEILEKIEATSNQREEADVGGVDISPPIRPPLVRQWRVICLLALALFFTFTITIIQIIVELVRNLSENEEFLDILRVQIPDGQISG